MQKLNSAFEIQRCLFLDSVYTIMMASDPQGNDIKLNNFKFEIYKFTKILQNLITTNRRKNVGVNMTTI